ncbi:MAG: ArsR family transcriptional regulator [Proteobacteria bacterium ST_bin15]|nr:MAG: ArsR family transcriptional regulator [Proteobacteria bacterium ST_bin15]
MMPDRLDRRLLSLLQQEGRMTTVELADRVGLSPTAVTERIKRLQRDEIILGYGARLSPEKLGRGFLAFIEITLDKTTPDVFDRFAAAISRVPDVIECHMVAGGFDYLVKVRVANMAAYRQLLGEAILALPGVRETRTYAVMEEIKSSPDLPV